MLTLMKRQDPFTIKRTWRDDEMRDARARGEKLNNSPVTALTFCHHPECARDIAELKTTFKREIARVGYEDVSLLDTKTICSGSCSRGPYVGMMGLGLFYRGIRKIEVSELLYETLFKNKFLFHRIALDPLKCTDARVIYNYKEGVLITLDPKTCMVGLAKYLYEFNALESCGKCTPCRAGCFHVTEIMKALVEGSAAAGDLAQLEALIWLMDQGAYCEFAPKVASSITLTLKEFREEYEAHLNGGTCAIAGCGDWGL